MSVLLTLLFSVTFCDAERAISTLNRIRVVSVMGYRSTSVAALFSKCEEASKGQRKRTGQGTRSARNCRVCYLGQVSDSGSSLSSGGPSFRSISTDASSSSALTVSDEESGTDSDSDSE